MHNLLKYMLATFSLIGSSNATAEISPLKAAFQQSRSQNNIDLVLPALLKARLYVVTGGQSDTNDYFLFPSPKKDRFCVTVSEDLDNLQNIKWPKIEITGEQLIKSIPSGIEIVVVYKDGGDYIAREHLQWYRSLLK